MIPKKPLAGPGAVKNVMPVQGHNVSKLIGAATLAALMLTVPVSLAAQTTATAGTTTSSSDAVQTTTTAPAAALNDDADTTISIVLLGDKVGLDKTKPQKGPFPDIMGVTTGSLGTDVSDYRLPGITLPEIATVVSEARNTRADVAVIFCGYADEQAEVKEEDLRSSILKIGADLKQRNAGMKVFIVPAATTVGALTSARIRMAAEEAGLNFVQLGTEVGGIPYKEAFREISEVVEGRTAPAKPEPAAAKDTVTAPAASTSPETSGPDMTARKASLERELSMPAGETNDTLLPLPPVAELLSTATLLEATATTAVPGVTSYPEGGKMTKRGKDAQENINMKPLPALKAFRPQIPVPRNQVDKKEPGLSR